MPPLLSDEMLEHSDGTFASVPQVAKDVSIVLEWCSNPWWDEQKMLCYKMIVALATINLWLWPQFGIAASSGYCNCLAIFGVLHVWLLGPSSMPSK